MEPTLQPLTGETMTYSTTNSDDQARLDIKARRFWGAAQQSAFFDVRIFNPNAPSYRGTQMFACYRRHEREKRRAYEQRIIEVEHGSFTPLVFNSSGGMGRAATVTYKRLAYLISSKMDQSYSTIMSWLRSAVMSLRGSRSRQGHAPHSETHVDVVVHECRVPHLEL